MTPAAQVASHDIITQKARSLQDNEPDRDKPLRSHWKANDYAFLAELNLPIAPNKKYAMTRESILIEARRYAVVAPGRWVSYSRSKNFYTRKYRRTFYSYQTVRWAVDSLTALGLLENEIAKNRPPRAGSRGVQSSFRATEKLISSVVLPELRYVPENLIVLKYSDKRRIGFRETAFTAKTRRNLEKINASLRSLNIELMPMPNLKVDGTIYEFTKPNGEILSGDLQQNQHYRVFNNGRWKYGGRFYGPCWQSMPKVLRKQLTLDGEPTIETDYPNLHPWLIYAEAGIALFGDAYQISGFDRKLSKIAFNVMVNADSDLQALRAIAEKIGCVGSYEKAGAIMTAIRLRHGSVERFFCSGAGRRLQRIDSDLAEAVILAANRAGIAILSVHDSFITQKRHEARILTIMSEQLERVLHRHIYPVNSTSCPEMVLQMVDPVDRSPDALWPLVMQRKKIAL